MAGGISVPYFFSSLPPAAQPRVVTNGSSPDLMTVPASRTWDSESQDVLALTRGSGLPFPCKMPGGRISSAHWWDIRLKLGERAGLGKGSSKDSSTH